MAHIIINESGESYDEIKPAAFFVIVLRQSIGDYDSSSITGGSKDLSILAWFLWLLILIIGNIVFMNFIIAVVSESYESCMQKKYQLIYRAKLEMIQECEDLMPDSFFNYKKLFPRFLIIRRKEGFGEREDNSDEWCGIVKQIQKHLEHENAKLKETLNRRIDSTKKEMKLGHEKVTADVKTDIMKVTADVAEVKTDIALFKSVKTDIMKVTADIAEVKTQAMKETAEMMVQINEMKLILSAVYKDKIAEMKAKEIQDSPEHI